MRKNSVVASATSASSPTVKVWVETTCGAKAQQRSESAPKTMSVRLRMFEV